MNSLFQYIKKKYIDLSFLLEKRKYIDFIYSPIAFIYVSMHQITGNDLIFERFNYLFKNV